MMIMCLYFFNLTHFRSLQYFVAFLENLRQLNFFSEINWPLGPKFFWNHHFRFDVFYMQRNKSKVGDFEKFCGLIWTSFIADIFTYSILFYRICVLCLQRLKFDVT